MIPTLQYFRVKTPAVGDLDSVVEVPKSLKKVLITKNPNEGKLDNKLFISLAELQKLIEHCEDNPNSDTLIEIEVLAKTD